MRYDASGAFSVEVCVRYWFGVREVPGVVCASFFGYFGDTKGYNTVPSEIWVTGDSEESEISAGNRLGMKKVQILQPGIKKSPKA